MNPVFQTSNHDYSAEIQMNDEFNYNWNFMFFKFHEIFDGLISLKNLKLLNAKIEYIQNCSYQIQQFLSIINRPYKTFFSNCHLNRIVVMKQKFRLINQTMILYQQTIQNCKILETFSLNGTALVKMLNKSEKNINI